MRAIADARRVAVARIVLAWRLGKPHVTSVIIGAERAEQLEDTLGAVDVVLTETELAHLDAMSALPPDYPGWMIDRQAAGRLPRPFARAMSK
jgi:aryl-alcohol dehydrogenase-like predicted oxidoreductase